MTNKVTNITTLCRKCIIKVSVGALCKWQVQYKCWSRYWPADFGPQKCGPQMLARKYWPANFGPQILTCKFWPANIDPQILASKNVARKCWPAKMWPANVGPQKCGPQILARSPHSSHSHRNDPYTILNKIPVTFEVSWGQRLFMNHFWSYRWPNKHGERVSF